MCDACPIDLVRAARMAADAIVGGYLRLPVAKALNLGTQHGLDQAIGLLAALLRSKAQPAGDAAVRDAVAVLDVDWRSTTSAQRASLVRQALEAAGRRTAVLQTQVQAVFGPAADKVVGATRDHARAAHGLAIGVDFNALDRRIVQHLARSEANFVRDEYGRRHDAFSAEARRIVAEGLEAGLGRDDIAADLATAAQRTLVARDASYWEVIAGSFVTHGRSFAQMSAYAEARIERYQVLAVMDEATTPICRFLDGKTFSVATALDLFDRVDAEPDRIKELSPWVREAADPKSGRRLLYVNRDGARVPVAEILRSGVGAKDDSGEYRAHRDERGLDDLGIGFPPYHGLCRSTTAPM